LTKTSKSLKRDYHLTCFKPAKERKLEVQEYDADDKEIIPGKKKRGQSDAPDATVPSTNQEQKEESDKRN
jgi:hypothetical protein